MTILLLFPILILSQTQNWVYSVDNPGAAMQVLYNNGNVYGVGSASTNNPEVFERTFFGVPYDETGGVVRQTEDNGYVIAGIKSSAGVYLIKLDFLGNLAWSKYYEHSTGVSGVCGLEITSDKGYILVTSVSSAIWLIKTDSLGDTLWTKTYPGASPGFSSKAVQQTLDNGYIIAGTAASNNGDLYILKTDSLGNIIWTKTQGDNRQQFGCSVRQTADSNYIVYAVSSVSGTSRASWLLKINSSGDIIWTKLYVLSGYPLGEGCAEPTIDDGYIIADGYAFSGTCFLLKTNAAGDSLWCRELNNYNPYNRSIDIQALPDGCYIVTTLGYPYLYLSKRDSLGNELWTSHYGSGLGAWGTSVYQTLDEGYIVAGTAKTAAAGDTTYDIYVVKTNTRGKQITQDFTITSLTVSGDLAWIYQYDGPKNAEDLGFTLTRGLDGNFYAGGFAKGTDDSYHSTVISIDADGNERWVYLHPIAALGAGSSPITTMDNVGVIYGSDGNIYASGHEINGDSGIIISLTPQGALNWCCKKSLAKFTSLIHGPDGNLYAVGFKKTLPSYQADFLILSISPGGLERWSYEKNVGEYDRAISIVADTNNNLYACGIAGSPGALDFTVISVDTAGAERWVYTLDQGSDDVAYSLVCGLNDNVYATGCCGFPLDWVIVNLDTSGNEKWRYTYDGPSHTDDWGHSIIYGRDGKIYTTGWSESSGIPDFTVICMNTTGDTAWVYRGPKGWGWSVVQGDDNNIYAGGDGWYVYTGKGFTVMSIKPPTGIEETQSRKLKTESPKLEVYPNPFSKKTVIRYLILDAGFRKSGGKQNISESVGSASGNQQPAIKIYDATGRLVRNFPIHQLTNSLINQIIWDATDDIGCKLPAGIYFCQLQYEDKRITKKIIKLQ